MSILTQGIATLTDSEFEKISALIYQVAGIHMNASKKALVEGRLRKRLVSLKLKSYAEYFKIVQDETEIKERQFFIDLLTTNETWFFREEKHFDFLTKTLEQGDPQQNVAIWSAACSSGQEPYSLAMHMAELRSLQRPWTIFATDISTKILSEAKRGVYLKDKVKGLPDAYIKKYMLKGVRSQDGYISVTPEIRKKIEFRHYNLLESALPGTQFDFIFCRNVLIYFDVEHKVKVIKRLHQSLKPGGYLITGHSESLVGIYEKLHAVQPSVYQCH